MTETFERDLKDLKTQLDQEKQKYVFEMEKRKLEMELEFERRNRTNEEKISKIHQNHTQTMTKFVGELTTQLTKCNDEKNLLRNENILKHVRGYLKKVQRFENRQ